MGTGISRSAGWECGQDWQVVGMPGSPVPPCPPRDLPRLRGAVAWECRAHPGRDREAGKATARDLSWSGASPEEQRGGRPCQALSFQPRYSHFYPSPCTTDLSPPCRHPEVTVVSSGHSGHSHGHGAEQPQPHGATAAVPGLRPLPCLDIGPDVTTVTLERSLAAGAAGHRESKGLAPDKGWAGGNLSPKFCPGGPALPAALSRSPGMLSWPGLGGDLRIIPSLANSNSSFCFWNTHNSRFWDSC